jgi:hypothetical protein
MNASIRSCLSSGIAAASVGALVLVPVAPGAASVPRSARQPVVALAAQVNPLVTVTPATSPQQVVGLLNQQVAFHVDLAVDFVVTGAQLVGRQLPVPGTLLRDIEEGTPLPVAAGRALRTLAEIEVDAGNELVGFAARYVDFQIRFVTNVVQDAVIVATAVPTVIGELAASTVAGLMPAARPASVTSDDTEPVSTRLIQTESSDEGSTPHSATDATSSRSTTVARHSTAVRADTARTGTAKDDDETASDTSQAGTSNGESVAHHDAATDGDAAARRDRVGRADHEQHQHKSAPTPRGDAAHDADRDADVAADKGTS